MTELHVPPPSSACATASTATRALAPDQPSRYLRSPSARQRPPLTRPRSQAAGLAIAGLVFIIALMEVLSQPRPNTGFLGTLEGSEAKTQEQRLNPTQPITTSSPPSPHFQAQALENGAQASVHGATLTPQGEGWLAAWYGGTREGAKDVQLFLSQGTPANKNAITWQPPRAFLSRETLSRDLNRYVKKLGNPVLYTTPDERVWLFFVSVSIGGWAGSAVNVMVSDDGGRTFSPPRRLTTSPFFNVSTLVRNRPISLANGGMVVPIYHEFLGKFCELLWLDADGNITDKQRLSWGRQTLQPSIVAQDAQRAAVFMRITAPKTHIEVAVTEDGGASFSKPAAINLPNSNAAVDATLLPDAQWLLVYNDDPLARDRLSLATADNPLGPWQQRVVLDQHRPDTGFDRFSYPAIVAARGQYHLLYTVERSFIQSVTFNAAWLEQTGSIRHD